MHKSIIKLFEGKLISNNVKEYSNLLKYART